MAIVTPSLTYYPDPTRGRPVFNGSIFVGQPDLDPEIEANRIPINLRLEDGSTVPIGTSEQPVQTGPGGVVLYNGSYAVVSADQDFSLKVLNNVGTQVYYIPNNENIFDSSQIGITIEGSSTNLENYLENRQVADYAELRALPSTDTNEGIIDGTVIAVTNDGIAGDFVVKTGTVTDNGGTLIVFTDDSNRYAERQFNSIVFPEWFGADKNGLVISTAEVQAAMDYCRSNSLYLYGTGKYLIDGTIDVGSGFYGFQFGLAGDLFVSSRYGLIWEGGDGDDTSPDTATPMLQFQDTQFIKCGPINLNNRKNFNTGIIGMKFSGTGSTQTGYNEFSSITCAGMDWGMVIGNSDSGSTDDVMEQSVIDYYHAYQVKNPLLLNGTSNDKIRFKKINIIGYQPAAEYNNGPSDYAIRIDQNANGSQFDDIVIAQHTNFTTDNALFDIVRGQPQLGYVSIEGGSLTARALNIANTAGLRAPIEVENIYCTEISDSGGITINLDTKMGTRVGTMTARGDIQCNSPVFGGNFVFKGSASYGVVGSALNVNVDIYRDDDSDDNIDDVNYGTYKAQNLVANADGFQKIGNIKDGIAVATSSLLSSGSPYTWATITVPDNVKTAISVKLKYTMFRGNAGANAVQLGEAYYVINRVDAGTVVATAVDGSDSAEAYAAVITNIVSVASVNVSGSDVELRIQQTTTPANSMRCIFSYEMAGASNNSTNDFDITINAS